MNESGRAVQAALYWSMDAVGTSVTDLTRGIYRRIYSGWIRGRRINSISAGAALAFLHLNLLADDFGNLPASPETLRTDAFPLRRVTIGQMASWLKELCDTKYADGTAAPLIRTYQVKGELYIHIEGFEENQPAGKNGRRVQRFPGESGGIRNEPLQSVPPHKHSELHSHSDTQHQHQHQSEVAGGAGFEARVKALTDKPAWYVGTAPWIDDTTARDLARLPIPDDVIAQTFKLAARKRKREGNPRGLENPAGWIVGELRKAAAHLNGKAGAGAA